MEPQQHNVPFTSTRGYLNYKKNYITNASLTE